MPLMMMNCCLLYGVFLCPVAVSIVTLMTVVDQSIGSLIFKAILD